MGVRGGSGAFNPPEDFGPNSRDSADVGIVAPVNESKTKVNVLSLLQDQTAEDEGPTIEASHFRGSLALDVMKNEKTYDAQIGRSIPVRRIRQEM